MQSTRKLGVIGESNSYYFTIPKEVIRKLKWRKGQKKTVKLGKGKIVIEDVRKE